MIRNILLSIHKLFPFIKKYLPISFKRQLYIHLFQREETKYISSKRSRRWLYDYGILKLLDMAPSGNILFVGVASYTWELIKSLEGLNGRKIVTLDIDQNNIWGAKNHMVGSILECDKMCDQKFSLVVINGVFGWGVNTASDITNSIKVILNVIQDKDSIIFIGWRPGTIMDPLNIPEINEILKPVDVGEIKSRICFEDDSQVYDIFMPR